MGNIAIPGPSTDGDRSTAAAILAALLPVKRRFPTLDALCRGSSPSATAAASEAIAPVLGSVTLAGALAAHQSLWRILNSRDDCPRESTAHLACLEWAWLRLAGFLWAAPAATQDDANARRQFVEWHAATYREGLSMEGDCLLAAFRALASDMDRLALCAPIPREATFAGWCASN